MLKLIERIARGKPAATLTLPFDARQKSRLRTTLDDGTEAAVWLPRGSVLRDGDLLRAEDGRVVAVRAEAEPVSTAWTGDARRFAAACYHLGNRHVPLQIGDHWVRYRHDHVLDEMVAALGLLLRLEEAPFEPEAGAYGGAVAHHPHGH